MSDKGRKKQNVEKWQRICCYFSWFAMVYFGIFFVVSIMLGGNAQNGTVIDGRYFLGNHGLTTEVSYPVFLFSQIHTASAIIIFLLGMGAAMYVNITNQGKPYVPRKKAKSNHPDREA